MPNMAVGQRVLITAVGTYLGQTTMTSWLYRVAAVTGTVDDGVFAAALNTNVQAAGGLVTVFRNCTAVDVWEGKFVWVQVLGPLRFRKVQFDLGDNGQYDAQTDTANLQASITRVGEFGTRRNVGGIRVPIASRAAANGIIEAALTVALGVLCGEMKLDIVAGGVTLVPQVGVPGITHLTDPPTQLPVTDSLDMADAFPQDTVRVIRRRTVRLGI